MKTSVATVEHILRKELLVPVQHLRLDQVVTSAARLSSFEWNVLLYHLENVYGVPLTTVSTTATVNEIFRHIEHNKK